ncbi:hypothetical protein SLS62_005816 [Diatrype stigma]|uniref:Cytochrome P450 n=1 Tax=Diatrype stigma TaxID=117547 RepID=A0AAN9UP49_9PEZI
MSIEEVSRPEGWPPTAATATTVAWMAGILTLYALAWQLSSRQDDPREPPVVAPTLIPIPFVGHLLGMALRGGRYVKDLGLRHRSLPIFTMRVLNQRVYVVTSPALAAAVQRASRALSFTPIIPEVTQPVLGLDDATMAIVRRNLEPPPDDDGEQQQRQQPGYLAEIQDLVYHALGPGPYLSELTLAAARELQSEVVAYAASLPLTLDAAGTAAGTTTTDLLLWVRHLVTVGTARYLYGPANPIALDGSLEEAFWDFDHGLVSLLVNVQPALTARRAYEGRERLAAALGDYLEAGRHLGDHDDGKKNGSGGEGSSSSWIIRQRVELALKHGWTLRAAARSELSFLFAGIVNTTTTTFWILARLYADAALLAAVRDEVEAAITITDDLAPPPPPPRGGRDDKEPPNTNKRRELRIPGLRERCPTLAAVFSECLRLGSDNFSNRKVREDTVLAGRYALKKGAIVQVAGGVIHADRGIWGDDVEAFNPSRFLPLSHGGGGVRKGDGDGGPEQQQQRPKQQQQSRHPAAFRAFGGGKTLCPGRHFAQHEILAFVALVVLAFDMCAPGGGGGAIAVPRKKDTGLPVHILEPTEPVKVVISRRAVGGGDRGVSIEDIDFTID